MPEDQTLDRLDKWAADMMKKHGWYAHYVFPTEADPVIGDTPTNTNIHTHGLEATFGHLDLQIVLPLAQQQAHGVLSMVVESIRSGNRYEAGQVTTELLEDPRPDGLDEMPIAFAAATECGRDVLRVILPDPNGSVERGNMTPEYEKQWEDIA